MKSSILYNIIACDAYASKFNRLLKYSVKQITRPKQNSRYNLLLSKNSKKFKGFKSLKFSQHDNYRSCIPKFITASLFYYNRKVPFDWIVWLDDDTFVNYDNMRSLVDTLSLHELEIHGVIETNGMATLKKMGTKVDFAHGGAGILMNRKTFNALTLYIKNHRKQHQTSTHYDVVMGEYVRLFNMNKPLSNQIIFKENPLFTNEWGRNRSFFQPMDFNSVVTFHLKHQIDISAVVNKINDVLGVVNSEIPKQEIPKQEIPKQEIFIAEETSRLVNTTQIKIKKPKRNVSTMNVFCK